MKTPSHKYRGYRTAKEFMDEILKDPAFIARMEEKERIRHQNLENYRKAASGVIAELKATGYNVETVQDLRRQFLQNNKPYFSAIPILIAWEPKVKYQPLKDDIIRTLSVPWAKPMAIKLMIKEFLNEDNANKGDLRWVIGNALWVFADDSIFDDIIKIAQNRQFGCDRQMVVLALGKMENPCAADVLIELLEKDEDNIIGYAIWALRLLKSQKARPYIEPFLQHRNTWIRNEAKKALKVIDKKKTDSTGG